SPDLQAGGPVVVGTVDEETLVVSSRSPRWRPTTGLPQSLEVDLTDFVTEKVESAIHFAFSGRSDAPIVPLLLGSRPALDRSAERARWMARWWADNGDAT